MDSFAQYLYRLLPSPLKTIGKKQNSWWTLCRVLGRHCDQLKATILDLREMSMILSCPPELLPVCGEEREMPRLLGEGVDAYRSRLTLKCLLAQKAGTRDGILLALASIGYEKSRIEPLWQQDAARWAEFTVYLAGAKQSEITDLEIVDAQVMAVKSASSMPAYGIDAGSVIEVASAFTAQSFPYPLCGATSCGRWPRSPNAAYLFSSGLFPEACGTAGEITPPRCGQTRAAGVFYRKEESKWR